FTSASAWTRTGSARSMNGLPGWRRPACILFTAPARPATCRLFRATRTPCSDCGPPVQATWRRCCWLASQAGPGSGRCLRPPRGCCRQKRFRGWARAWARRILTRCSWTSAARWITFRHVEDIRALMVAYGDGDKQVAVTELGWTSDDTHPDYSWFAVDEQ